MLVLPAIRWGQPYESLEVEEISHFLTGEPVAKLNTVNAGIIRRDARQAKRARQALRELSPAELIEKCKQAGDLFENGSLLVGDGTQNPEQFVAQQSATTGMPISMCCANVSKNAFVLKHIDKILDALTRGLDLDILARGYGDEERGVTVSYQAQTDVLGAVLPSNSPGVHTLWLPVVALQIGLALKPGSQEPWTPYRVIAALIAAGIPAEAFSIYPGAGSELGGALLASCRRSMIFGGPQTVEQYAGNPQVQVHGPGYSKILIGDDVVDDWPRYLELMVDSVYRNGGRSCINCSSIYASRHTAEIADALAEKLGSIAVLPPDNPQAGLAAFTTPNVAPAVWQSLEKLIESGAARHATAPYGPRLIQQETCDYLLPTVLECSTPDSPAANVEYMFPMVSVVRCPQAEIIGKIGPTLVATAISEDPRWRDELIACTQIDRLNLGAIPTPQVDWLQPHEGNLIEFLFRNRALQVARTS